MADLDYTLLSALKSMSAGKSEVKSDEQDTFEITKDSSDKDILDYILLYLCGHTKRMTNYYKGGYVLMNIVPNYARYSRDIDFSISSEEQYEEIKKILRGLGDELVSRGVVLSYAIKETITPTSSGGIKLDRGEEKLDLGIDIGWHDVSYGMSEWKFHGYDLMRFTVERMLSDKLSAIYSPKRFRRTKDLYDVYILNAAFDIDYKKLKEYIERRNTIDWSKDPFREDVQIQYSAAYDKLKITNAVNDEVYKPPFGKCMEVLHMIVNKLKEV